MEDVQENVMPAEGIEGRIYWFIIFPSSQAFGFALGFPEILFLYPFVTLKSWIAPQTPQLINCGHRLLGSPRAHQKLLSPRSLHWKPQKTCNEYRCPLPTCSGSPKRNSKESLKPQF
jgi:hypothetical protein